MTRKILGLAILLANYAFCMCCIGADGEAEAPAVQQAPTMTSAICARLRNCIDENGRIPNRAFAYDNLQAIHIFENVREIGESAFLQCRNLSTLTFAPRSILRCIGQTAFCDSAVQSVVIPRWPINMPNATPHT